MNSVVRSLLLITGIATYGLLFAYVEETAANKPYTLSPVLPPAMQQIGLGYLHQLGGDIAFIQASVFHGGLPAEVDPNSYADTLSDYYRAMQALQPRLGDLYYKCESHLAWMGGDRTRFVNHILEQGMPYNPQSWLLPYFAGFNYFYYLKEPLNAARLLEKAVEIRGYPGILGKLATILLGRGGDIYGGLIWLKAMQAQEDDPEMKARYQASIDVYEQARNVLLAIDAFKKTYDHYPDKLQQLVPDFISRLPDMKGTGYSLAYEAPNLRLMHY